MPTDIWSISVTGKNVICVAGYVSSIFQKILSPKQISTCVTAQDCQEHTPATSLLPSPPPPRLPPTPIASAVGLLSVFV